jgi:hypothetical protein
MLTWVSLLLAAAIYIAGIFGPLEPLSPSVSPIYLLAAASNASGPLLKVSGASAHYKPSTARDKEADQLFGMETEPVTGGSLLNEWRRVEVDITNDLEVVAHARRASLAWPAHKS